MELGIPYTLIGPDGTRVVFGNSDAAMADPDWVGFIDPEQGISGLDAAEFRGTLDELVEQDGAVAGPGFDGARPVTIPIILNPDMRAGAKSVLERKLKRAARARREDSVLRWTPSDVGVELELRLRRNAKPNTTGRHPTTVLLPMVSADNLTRSSAEASLVIDPNSAGGVIGYTSPYTSPYGTEFGVAGQQSVVNQGDDEAIPRFRLRGPITNPELLHNDTGRRIKLAVDLAASETLDVDVGRKTVELLTPLVLGDPTNIITNPRAGVDLTGIGGATAGILLTRLAGGGLPGGYETGVLSSGPAATATGVVASYGKSGTGLGVAAHPVTPLDRLGVRGWARIDSLVAGAITNLNLRMYWYKADGSASATAFTTVASQSNPVVGQDYEFVGLVDVPADAAFGVPRYLTAQTNPSTWDIETTAVAAYVVAADETVVPGYADGDMDGYAWEGAIHNSRSRRVATYNRSSRFGAVVFPDTKWWRLAPGSNDVRLLASAFSAGSTLTVYWRHAWE